VKTFENQRNATQTSDLYNSDPTRRVDRLLRLIAQPDWLAEAAWVTLSSKGANTPGIDEEIKRTVQARLPAILKQIRNDLLSDAYSPLPARRVYIPKANGKQRPLGHRRGSVQLQTSFKMGFQSELYN
jgi:retron-type reverse transcriptase